MKKPKINRTTGHTGIYLYDPSASKPRYYIQFRYGKNPNTGKSITIKKMTDKDGSHLTTIARAKQYMEELKVEADVDKKLSYNNHMLYSDFMDNVYIPAYKTEVQHSTFSVRKQTLLTMRNRFAGKALKDITAHDVQNYRTYLLTAKEDGGTGYSQAYASLVFGMFRKTLDKAVELDFLDSNISKKIKAIPKGKATVPYWTKKEFEKVIQQIYVKDYYQHLNFVMLWVYFMTGIRVNEGCALYWRDVDFKKKQLRIQHMLIYKNKNEWNRKNHTKTAGGKRIISLDDDTIQILKDWKQKQATQTKSNFIFSYNAHPMTKSTISRIINRYSKLAVVHKIQAKGLRHSHASYLINEFNIDILMLSRRLGHSGPEITLKHYSHLYPNRDELIAQKMTGNINIKTADMNHIKFNGNQSIAIRCCC